MPKLVPTLMRLESVEADIDRIGRGEKAKMAQDGSRLKQEMQAIMERISEVESELEEYKYAKSDKII